MAGSENISDTYRETIIRAVIQHAPSSLVWAVLLPSD